MTVNVEQRVVEEEGQKREESAFSDSFFLLSSNPEVNRLIRKNKEKNLSLRELAFIVHIWVLIFLDLD